MSGCREIKQGSDYLGVNKISKKISLSKEPDNKVWIEHELETIYRQFELAESSPKNYMSINCLCTNGGDNNSIRIEVIGSGSICTHCNKDTTWFIKENSSRDNEYRLKHACNDRYVNFKEKKLKLERQKENAQVWKINEVS